MQQNATWDQMSFFRVARLLNAVWIATVRQLGARKSKAYKRSQPDQYTRPGKGTAQWLEAAAYGNSLWRSQVRRP